MQYIGNMLNVNIDFEKCVKKDGLIWEKKQSFNFNGIEVDFIFEIRNNPIKFSAHNKVNNMLNKVIKEYQIERYARFTMPNKETILSLIGVYRKSFDKDEEQEKITEIKNDFSMYLNGFQEFCNKFPIITENLINEIIEGDTDMPFGRFMLNAQLIDNVGKFYVSEEYNKDMIERGFFNNMLYETENGYNLEVAKETIKEIAFKVYLNDKLNAKLKQKQLNTKKTKI